MKAIGLDIGTTTICGVVLDAESGKVLYSSTLPNDSFINSGASYERIQDPSKIWSRIREILSGMAKEHPDVISIGMTGQMHGILYVDGNGEAVSPLYTWQDESGNRLCPGTDKTYAQVLTEKTGCFAATGFGLTTYFAHSCEKKVPENAAGLTTIMDYVVMKLTGEKKPLITPSNAASLGVYDLKKNEFLTEKVRDAGMDPEFLPKVVKAIKPAGKVQPLLGEGGAELPYTGVPVSSSLGDNQASVIGSVMDTEDTILVNIGTGSQISVGTKNYVNSPVVELRPLTGENYIFAGSCLCGGRSYAALENFFRDVLAMAGVSVDGKLYDRMARAMEQNPQVRDSHMEVDTRFCGTRENPSLRGSMSGISLDNLSAASMIWGFLYGSASELHNLYEEILPLISHKPTRLVGSGNGIRMNGKLQAILEELFGMKLQIPAHREEAAYGTALYSLVAAGFRDDLRQAQSVIKYVGC